LSERRQILVLVSVTLIIAFAGTQIASIIMEFEGEAVVSEYHAVFQGNGILEETFTYKINTEGKRFLFR
jgi:hypothetical protein